MSLPVTAIFPIGFTLLDTFLVVFIKATSSNGVNTYSTFTANAITEAIKLSIAYYSVRASGDFDELKNISWIVWTGFLISNLMYAANNNLFQYSIGALTPAVFIVTINALRTIMTAALQHCVNGKQLSVRQMIACVLLFFSFIAAAFPDIQECIQSNSFGEGKFATLLFLGSVYSIISTTASLTQEKLLKDSGNIMTANVINYSIGVTFQTCAVLYMKTVNGVEIFKGFSVFWIQLIPLFMALSGLCISFVLRYYDNIVKLLCSSIVVLLVHVITSYLSGKDVLSIPIFIAWMLTLPAVYLYNSQPATAATSKEGSKQVELPKYVEVSNTNKNGGSGTVTDDLYATIWNVAHQHGILIIALITLLGFSILNSSFEMNVLEQNNSAST